MWKLYIILYYLHNIQKTFSTQCLSVSDNYGIFGHVEKEHLWDLGMKQIWKSESTHNKNIGLVVRELKNPHSRPYVTNVDLESHVSSGNIVSFK